MNPTQTVLLRPQTKKTFTNKQATPEWYRRCYNKIGDLECHPFKLLFIMLFLFWTLLSLPRPALCFKFHLYLQVQILDDIFDVFINVFQHFTVICFNFHLIPSSKRLERCFFWCNKSQLDFVRSIAFLSTIVVHWTSFSTSFSRLYLLSLITHSSR